MSSSTQPLRYHLGRSWTTHELEDDCPCGKAACGLVDSEWIDPECPQHAFPAAKTMRQMHTPEECPGVRMSQRDVTALPLRVVGVYEGSQLPAAVDVVKLLQVEQHPWGTGTATKRYYVLLVSGGAESQPGIPATFSLHLDNYEISNLRAGLETLRKLNLDTGDWLGQILFKLPEVDHNANVSVEAQLVRARVPE